MDLTRRLLLAPFEAFKVLERLFSLLFNVEEKIIWGELLGWRLNLSINTQPEHPDKTQGHNAVLKSLTVVRVKDLQ